MSHTCGPWVSRYVSRGLSIRKHKDNRRGAIAWISPTLVEAYGAEECEANARLIAKAPEMYDLLQEWLGAVTIETDQGLIAKTEALLSEIEP